MDTYSHVLEAVKRETAYQMDAIFMAQEKPELAQSAQVAQLVAQVEASGSANWSAKFSIIMVGG